MQETWVWSLGWKDPLEKGTATHSSILAWIIPWTEEPGRLQSTGWQRVRHFATFTWLHWRLWSHRIPTTQSLNFRSSGFPLPHLAIVSLSACIHFWHIYFSGIFTFFVLLPISLGKVSLQRAFDLIDYLRNETYTAPISEALFQTELIYNLLDKLGHMDLASRLVVSLPFAKFSLLLAFTVVIHVPFSSHRLKKQLYSIFITLLVLKS